MGTAVYSGTVLVLLVINAAGRNTRDVHDARLVLRPAEHKLDGNLSACGASCAVLRKVKNEPAQHAVRAAQGIAANLQQQQQPFETSC